MHPVSNDCLRAFVEGGVVTVRARAADVLAAWRGLAPTNPNAEPLKGVALNGTQRSRICSEADAKHVCAGGKRCSAVGFQLRRRSKTGRQT